MSVDLTEKFCGKSCILLGAGVSNMPLAKMLTELGAKVEVRDKKSLSEMGERGKELEALGVSAVSGDGYLENMRAASLWIEAKDSSAKAVINALKNLSRKG